jgi:hypothetical protein
VVVPVPFVCRVAVSVVDVVDMVTVRDGHMPAPGPVLVVMGVVRDVRLRLALVHVLPMEAMEASVVNVVDMIGMRNGHVPAPRAVPMSVISMLVVFGGNNHVQHPLQNRHGDPSCGGGLLNNATPESVTWATRYLPLEMARPLPRSPPITGGGPGPSWPESSGDDRHTLDDRFTYL